MISTKISRDGGMSFPYWGSFYIGLFLTNSMQNERIGNVWKTAENASRKNAVLAKIRAAKISTSVITSEVNETVVTAFPKSQSQPTKRTAVDLIDFSVPPDRARPGVMLVRDVLNAQNNWDNAYPDKLEMWWSPLNLTSRQGAQVTSFTDKKYSFTENCFAVKRLFVTYR